ncbi:alpha/beta hydrolase [Streptomyces mirabilis]
MSHHVPQRSSEARRHLTTRYRRQALATTVAALSLLVSGLTVASASSADATAKSGEGVATASSYGSTKPTIVLVHGAWADSSGFDSEITTLTRLGYPVVTIANPLRSLTGDAAYVHARLATISGPIVLVGHSYGGAVITNAAVGVPNVKALVYVAAFSLAEGESLATVLPSDQYPGSHLDSRKLDVVPVANLQAPGGQDADLYIKPANFADIFAGDVSEQEAALEAATQRPLSSTAYTQASGTPAWVTIPSWDLITLDDHAISPAGQKFMAGRMHAHTETVQSAHDVMVSHPAAVDRIILEAAATT